jgi:hypothetical protein
MTAQTPHRSDGKGEALATAGQEPPWLATRSHVAASQTIYDAAKISPRDQLVIAAQGQTVMAWDIATGAQSFTPTFPGVIGSPAPYWPGEVLDVRACCAACAPAAWPGQGPGSTRSPKRQSQVEVIARGAGGYKISAVTGA